jgi:hypothetical protein
VLVVDQLEETWTSCGVPEEREAFLDALSEIADSDAGFTVVLVVRADYVGRLADRPGLVRALADATVLVGAPTEPELRRAVEHPAQRAGLHLDIGLADALVADAAGGPGLLPLLSTALTELWDHRDGRRLTLAAYATAGGIRGAVARLAERAFGLLDPPDQAAARVLLLRLAGPGDGGTATRRRVPLSDLAALPDARVAAVVGPLAEARLLTLDAGHVEVAHEALFREWPRLRAWLEEDVAARAVQRRLVDAAMAMLLTPPIRHTLESAVEFIADDELVEITPSASAQAPAARARAQTRLPRRRLRKSPPAGGGQVTGWWEQALT